MKKRIVSWEIHIEDICGSSEICGKEYESSEIEEVISDAITLSELGYDVFIVPYVYYNCVEENSNDN